MSRISLVVGCGLLTVVGLVLSDRLGAQEEASGPVATQATQVANAVQRAEDRIDAVLDKQLKAPLDFVDTPLQDVVDHLQKEYEIPILFDTAALDEVAISVGTEITARLKYISLRSALDLMLRQPDLEDLTYVIDREVLLITTKDRANETLQTKVYRVDDLDHFGEGTDGRGSKTNCYSPLRDVIVSCVEYVSWQENETGEGDLDLMKPGMLVVTQTHSVHQKIEKLLADLRKVKSKIEGSSGSDF